MKCLGRSRTSARSLFPEKSKAELPEELKGQTVPQGERVAPTASRHPEEPQRGPHNKENRSEQRRSVGPESGQPGLSRSSLAEDSGYLSLHNSQLEHPELGSPIERSPERRDSTGSSDTRPHPGSSDTHPHPHPGSSDTRPHPGSSDTRPHPGSSDTRPHPGSSCLPVLQFQEEVCRALSESYKKSQSYDWTIIDQVAEHYNLQNVIGGKMGLEHVDILCGLMKKDMKHILTRILGLLGDLDLISCRKVSKTWCQIICEDSKALQRCRNGEKLLRESRSVGSLSRDFCLSRVVFSCLQTVASSTPVQKHTKAPTNTDGTPATSKPSRFAEVFEATKSLKCHEALRCCRLCGSPARYDSAMQRAICVRGSCAFDFCSLCQSAYHGAKPCQRGVIRSWSRSKTAIVAGSARSKRNVRRL